MKMNMRRNREMADDVVAIALRYRPAVEAYIRRRVSNAARAEELTQDVFLSLAKRASAEPIANLEGYIFQIAANLVRDAYRSKQAHAETPASAFADPFGHLIDEISPEREMLGREAYAQFVQAMEMLPERPRTVFILNRFEEMTGREIAAALGVSQRTVEKDISRVLTHLRERLS